MSAPEEDMRRIVEARDRTAFEALFRHFAPRVKAYLMRGGAAAEVAEDLAQEALLTVWRKAELFDPAKAAVSTWVFTIARNLRIDHIRRERHPNFDPADPTLVTDWSVPADDGIEAQQDGERLRRALYELPAEQMQILTLSFFSDKSHSQIADELDVPLGTVKSRIRLAMARLRTLLGEEP